jgi:hypothetical protein
MARVRKDIDTDDLVARYLGGISENALARSLGVSRSVIQRRLSEAGVERRGQSDAERVKWAALRRQGREAIERQCGGAWAARRGSVASKIELKRKAQTRSRKVGIYETDLAAALLEVGHQVEQQVPVGPYNLDLLVDGSIAVEVEFYGFKRHSRAAGQRLEQMRRREILGCLFVLVRPTRGIDLAEIVKQVVAFSDRVRRHPAPMCQYGVIRGHGERSPARPQTDGAPRVVGF